MPHRHTAQPAESDQIRQCNRWMRGLRGDFVPGGVGRISMTAPETDTLPKVSAFPPPVLRWRVVPPPDTGQVQSLAATLKLPPALAALLIQRGHGTEEGARRFLRPSLDVMSDPMALAGMAQAVEAVADAGTWGRRILVHGDYDVDGQCASALLTRALGAAGADDSTF